MVMAEVIEFQAHVQAIIRNHFGIVYDAEYLSEHHERQSPHYATYLWTNENPINLTSEQTYLKSLFDLITPVLEVDSLRKKVRRAKATRSLRASECLVRPCKFLSFEAYHFSERLKGYCNAAKAIASTQSGRDAIELILARRIKTFKSKYKDILAYRNYMVHGGNKIIDPFRDISYMELASITGHPDLWFEFQNLFEEAQEFWIIRATEICKEMVLSLAEIKSVNEELVQRSAFRFLAAS